MKFAVFPRENEVFQHLRDVGAGSLTLVQDGPVPVGSTAVTDAL